MSEYKKYDSDSNYENWSARLTEDATVRDYDGKKFVKIKFTDETRGPQKDPDRYETMWIEGEIVDFDADKAAYLKKGDVLPVEGHLAFRLWGEDNDKVAFDLKRCRIHVNAALMNALKDRGFSPGGSSEKPSKAKKGSKKKIVEIPEDDDE